MSYPAENYRAWHQIDGELIPALDQIPPCLNVGDIVGVAD